MDIDKKLELLAKIKRVEAPPFLFTRILERIDSRAMEKAPATWRVALVTATLLILTLNVSVLFRASDKPKESDVEEVINSMRLSRTNDLYHE
ncbi:MAG: hypothetical protein C0523_07510 [Cytophaga sp.]|nr:hypothetical protein [Cytophaga sp.]